MIQKFIHSWLPVNTHPGQQKTGLAVKCPHCTADETLSHSFTCHSDKDTWTTELLTACKTPKNQTAAHPLYNLLRTTLLNPPLPDHPSTIADSTPIQLYKLHHEQNLLGWSQILQGRWSTQWVTQYDQLTHTSKGITWASQVLLKLWKIIINKWKRRCEAEHTANPSRQAASNEELDRHIDLLYASQHDLDHVDRIFFNQPVATTKSLPIHRKKQWTARATTFVHQGIRRATIRRKIQTQAITTFFLPKNTTLPFMGPPPPPPNATSRTTDYHPP